MASFNFGVIPPMRGSRRSPVVPADDGASIQGSDRPPRRSIGSRRSSFAEDAASPQSGDRSPWFSIGSRRSSVANMEDNTSAPGTDRSFIMESGSMPATSEAAWSSHAEAKSSSRSSSNRFGKLKRLGLFGLGGSTTSTLTSEALPEQPSMPEPLRVATVGLEALQRAAVEYAWHLVWPQPGAEAPSAPVGTDAVILVHTRGRESDTSEALQGLRKILGATVPIVVLLFDVCGVEAGDHDYVMMCQEEHLRHGADDTVCNARSERELKLAVDMSIRRRDYKLNLFSALRIEAKQAVTDGLKEVADAQSNALFWQCVGRMFKGFPDMKLDLPVGVCTGTRVGPCIIRGPLGEGNFGKVYSAANGSTGATEAVKVIDKGSIKQSKEASALHREVNLHSRLRHKHVVEFLGIMHGPSHIFIRMEAVLGGNLFGIMKASGGTLPRARAKGIAAQLADAVSYCHENGVAHRDLKPENVALDVAGENIKVLDFGCCVTIGATRTDTVGSVPFMAPEVFIAGRDRPYEPAGVDMWSFGVILVELLCGLNHFERQLGWGRNTRVSTRRHAELARFFSDGRIAISKLLGLSSAAVDADLNALLCGMLQVDAAKRWTAERVCRSQWLA